MSTQQKIHVKLQNNKEFRRFVIEPNIKFYDLKQMVANILKIKTPFALFYLDEESEWITIDTDIEVQIGVELSSTLLRLKTEISEPQRLTNPVVKEKKIGGWRNHINEIERNNIREWWRRFDNTSDSLEDEKSVFGWNGRFGVKQARSYQRFSPSHIRVTDHRFPNPVEKEKKKGGWRNHINEIERNNFREWDNIRVPYQDNPFDSLEDEKSVYWNGRYGGWRNNTNEIERNHISEIEKNNIREWDNFRVPYQDNSFDSLEEKSYKIKNEDIGSLKEKMVDLINKKNLATTKLVELENQLKSLRRNGTKEEIVYLKDLIAEKRKASQLIDSQITKSRNRIWELKRGKYFYL